MADLQRQRDWIVKHVSVKQVTGVKVDECKQYAYYLPRTADESLCDTYHHAGDEQRKKLKESYDTHV